MCRAAGRGPTIVHVNAHDNDTEPSGCDVPHREQVIQELASRFEGGALTPVQFESKVAEALHASPGDDLRHLLATDISTPDDQGDDRQQPGRSYTLEERTSTVRFVSGALLVIACPVVGAAIMIGGSRWLAVVPAILLTLTASTFLVSRVGHRNA